MNKKQEQNTRENGSFHFSILYKKGQSSQIKKEKTSVENQAQSYISLKKRFQVSSVDP